MTAAEIQKKILFETGLKTSVKKYSNGSMNGYLRIMPIFQNGSYPSLPFDFVQKLKSELAGFDYANKPVFCSCTDICVYQIDDDRLNMKKESKPKPIEQMKVKQWGSKNSQMRYDKAITRNHKRVMRGDGGARFY